MKTSRISYYGGKTVEHVVALDVSMGKSALVVYNRNKVCEYEGELEHTRFAFETLHKRLQVLTIQDGKAPEIVFEATGVYSKGIEAFLKEYGYQYCRINPLEASL